MRNLKDRMYDYEVSPPEGVWNDIVSELDGNSAIIRPVPKRRTLYYTLAAAAAVAILVLCLILFKTNSTKTEKEYVSANNPKQDSSAKKNKSSRSNGNLMRVPDAADKENKNQEDLIAENKTEKGPSVSGEKPNPAEEKNDSNIKEEINNNVEISDIAMNSNAQNYITIAGPEGQPVKVSSKVAALIESSDDNYPPKPVWNKKINKWKNLMQANTLAPTPGNFLDIVELNNTLKDNNN